jgi:uncharacterized protein
MIPIRDSSEGASFAVRVHPRAKKTAITGVFGEGPDAALKVALSAPPVDGRANEALIEFFADLFRVPRSAVSVVSGAQSRSKVLRVAGRTAAELLDQLAAARS